MQVVVGVRFNSAGKIYYFDPNFIDLKVKDLVVVETEQGLELGTIQIGKTKIEDSELSEPLKKVVRLATEKDRKTREELDEKEKEVFEKTKKIIQKHKLEMDLIMASYTFDGSKIIFTYTAEGRVDFRELIKELASTFKAKIELRQVGIRDEAKYIGGLGPCGREVCCKKFLEDFAKVSIKMAKNQNLSLNPSNISGLCGRLMCCLSYENEHYAETIKLMPKLNSMVKTPDGEGLVVYNDLLKRIVSVKFINDDGQEKVVEYELDKLKFKKENDNE